MKNRFILKPMQPELNHLVLAYNTSFDEYILIDLHYNAITGLLKYDTRAYYLSSRFDGR